jgi:hypothetical protein
VNGIKTIATLALTAPADTGSSPAEEMKRVLAKAQDRLGTMKSRTIPPSLNRISKEDMAYLLAYSSFFRGRASAGLDSFDNYVSREVQRLVALHQSANQSTGLKSVLVATHQKANGGE